MRPTASGIIQINRALLFIVLSVILLIPACKSEDVELLPDSTEGILKDGGMDVYTGAELYDYMDGAAEIYFRHNFASCLTQNYKLIGVGESVPANLEIYNMGSEKNAESLFDELYGGEFKSIGIGARSIQSENDEQEIAFCLDRYLCKLIAYQRSDFAREKLLSLATKTASRIGKTKE
ncbi:MAG: DUF6599 family protein [Candidatus Poribacteria bacterium]